jgi:tetratricopeptide (TPR) repeat protein
VRPALPTVALLLTLAAPVRAQAPAASFEEAARQAAAAREAGRTGDAIALYREAVGTRPSWDEGWWYLGTLLYEGDRYAEAVPAFDRFTHLKPEVGAGWALLGLCEFGAGDRAAARASLEKAVARGTGTNRDLLRAAERHRALLLVKEAQFERAMEPLTTLARMGGGADADLAAVVGLAILRMPLLPTEVAPDRRDLVLKAGRAGLLYLATRQTEGEAAFAELLRIYPSEPWVHYAHGAFLKKVDRKRAMAEFRRELEIQPDCVYPLLEIAYELLLRGDFDGARGAAERAAKLAPGLFAGRHALGRALVGAGQVREGIVELEEAARLAPDVPEMHFALAQAYARAGRPEDVARARARFLELQKEREARGQPGAAVAPQ